MVHKRPFRWFARALCVTAGAVGAVAAGQPAHAYKLETSGACTEIRWSTPRPVYKIHINEFDHGGGTVDDLVAMVAAVYDVMREFDNAGGTTAEVDLSGITTDARPYDADTPFNDPSPTIHIGFTSDPYKVSADGRARASTKYTVDQSTCTYKETRITFRDLNLQPWDFGTPASANDTYYRATDTDPGGKMWFRPIMLHELLHSFGLDHSHTTYSFMNYLDYPWAGGGVAESDAIRPLPDDLRALRHLYPGTSSRAEVALLTTWYDDDPLLNQSESAAQLHVCTPSLGDAFSSSTFDYYCGTGGPKSGSTKVCAGDLLYTRFTLANYSTEQADDLDITMYLSTDDVYSSHDVYSPTFRELTVKGGHSAMVEQKWEVPTGLASGTRYQVIVHAIGTTSSGAFVEDWTPLTAPVTAC